MYSVFKMFTTNKLQIKTILPYIVIVTKILRIFILKKAYQQGATIYQPNRFIDYNHIKPL